MIKISRYLNLFIIIALTIACVSLTIIWPEWRSELKAAGSYQEAKLYGLFIGVSDKRPWKKDTKCDEMVLLLDQLFKKLPNHGMSLVMPGDADKRPISDSQIDYAEKSPF